MIMNDLTLLFNLTRKKRETIMLYLWVRKNEFMNLGLNVKEGCYGIKVLFTSLILLEMKQ